MEETGNFEAWTGNTEEFSQLEYIQYSRGLFPRKMPSSCLHTFFTQLPQHLRDFQARITEQDKDSFVRGSHDEGYYTDEIDLGEGWLLFVIYRRGRLTLLSASSDEDVQARLRSSAARQEWTTRYGEEVEGFYQKRLQDFLRLAHIYMVRHRRTCKPETFQAVFESRLSYILDTVQLEAVEASDDDAVLNIFLSGSTGTGKSTAGLRWLTDHPGKSGSRLGLLFSETQRSRCEEWLEHEQRVCRKSGGEELPHVRLERWIDYLMTYAAPYRGRGMYALNPQESYGVFYEICKNLPPVFWKAIPGEGQMDKEFFLWGEIHGFIKGALFYRNPAGGKVSEPLNRQQYIELKSFYKGRGNGAELSGQIVTALYRIYDRYEEYLASHHFLDDNDVARLILRNLEEIRKREDFQTYELIFLDDCQELTQIQLQAFFSLADGCDQKFMTMDRCQMMQPTLFHLGFTQQMAERQGEGQERRFSERYRLLKHYRSLLELVRFRGSILDEMKHFHQLKEEDLLPADFAGHDLREGHLPLWITDTEENRENLGKLITEFREGQVYVLHARPLRAAERDGKNFCLEEYRGTGLSAPVLLWNMFTEAAEYVSRAQAWEYFYMGASCPEKYLLLLEPEGGEIGTFLEGVWERGIIEKCTSLPGPASDGCSWLEKLRARIPEIADTSVMDRAYDLYLNDDYEGALSLYRQYPEHPGADEQCMICFGKLAEEDRDYALALEWYIGLGRISHEADWSIRELQENPGLPPEVRFASELYYLKFSKDPGNRSADALKKLYGNYRENQGTLNLKELLDNVLGRYPDLQSRLEGWTRDVCQNMDSWAGMILSVTERENDWRRGHE